VVSKEARESPLRIAACRRRSSEKQFFLKLQDFLPQLIDSCHMEGFEGFAVPCVA
jgi:hypothetical protein